MPLRSKLFATISKLPSISLPHAIRLLGLLCFAVLLGACQRVLVDVSPGFQNASGALLNNYSLFEDEISIIHSESSDYQDWQSVYIAPREQAWGDLVVSLTGDSMAHLRIEDCFEPVDGINILRCDLQNNPFEISEFTLRQTFERETDIDGLSVPAEQDDVVIELFTDNGSDILLGQFAPYQIPN